ncbi:hypothetical protein BC826DRAFT_295289 [Russula brevipes]|nr:hypothetical protein BC826DRAFT_295289 [Russula brevipes]
MTGQPRWEKSAWCRTITHMLGAYPDVFAHGLRGEIFRPWRRPDRKFSEKRDVEQDDAEWETGRLGRTWAIAVIHRFLLRLPLIDVCEKTLETQREKDERGSGRVPIGIEDDKKARRVERGQSILHSGAAMTRDQRIFIPLSWPSLDFEGKGRQG